MEKNGQLHASATLSLLKSPHYLLGGRLRGPQSRCEEGRNRFYLKVIELLFLRLSAIIIET
jgi:hypothetical protein